VPDLNAPFECPCGGTRFFDLIKINASCCQVPEDIATNPRMIGCASCGNVFRQTPDWTWELGVAVMGQKGKWEAN
jgi:hypothetical protein